MKLEEEKHDNVENLNGANPTESSSLKTRSKI